MEGDHRMNNTETVALTALITQIWPSMKLNAYSADAWHPVLEDLPYAVAENAVLILAKSHSGYVQPYDIRRQAAKAAGLLAPDEADALQMALDVAGNSGTGASLLPPAVKDAYWAMGGSQGFQVPPGVLRPQWGRVYRDCVIAREEQLLAGDLGTAIENSRPAAIAAAPESFDPDVPPMSADEIEHNQERLERAYLHVESKWNRNAAVPSRPGRRGQLAIETADAEPGYESAKAVLQGLGNAGPWLAAAVVALDTEGQKDPTPQQLAICAAGLATRTDHAEGA
jgi:hypothetical protein